MRTDKQQIIEEMVDAMAISCGECYSCQFSGKTNNRVSCTDYLSAEALYNAGYRKVDAGQKIICENEYDKFMGKRESYKRVLKLQANEIERLYQIKLDLEHQLTQKGLTEYVGADVIKAETRKETAKEIFGEIYKLLNSIKKQDYEDSLPYYCADVEEFDDKLYILAKQFGVEVE